VLPATTLRFPDHSLIGAPAIIVVLLLLNVISVGQTTPSSSQQGTLSTVASASTKSSDKQNEKTRRGEFVVAPIPISSPALGTGIVPVVGYIFRVDREDKVSPASLIGAAGLITNNGSRAFAVAGQLYLKRDTYHASAAFLQGNLNYNLYGIGASAGSAGFQLPLKQDGSVFLGEFLRKLKWKFVLGPRILTGHSSITRRPGGSDRVLIPSGLTLNTKLTALGFRINRDSRPNRFYPESGAFFDLTSDFFATGLGSKYSFQTYRASFSKYWGFRKKQVLAYNAYFCGTGGEPPFYGNCIYGTNNELRGYEAGRYIDRYMVATQLEYRLALPKRFGIVGFGGIGGVAPGAREFFYSTAFLPAGGGGLRFMLSKTYHVNFRADIAAGKNGHTFGMGVSEAF
jgi:hypothetical protein